MYITIVAVFSLLSGILYRFGGWGDEGRRDMPWMPKWMFNTKARDVGCALCGFAVMLATQSAPWWIHPISFLLLFGALTTYWDFLFSFDNHWFHGFMCALAYFPYAIVSGCWIGFVMRCIALAILMGGVSALSGNDDVEEIGRGAFIPLTLPLLLI